MLYVWFDAPIGYISNTKELLPDSWETWWKDPETRLINFIGKDNIVFHCIVFPAMLKAEGSYILPDNVPSNEFLNLEGIFLLLQNTVTVYTVRFVLPHFFTVQERLLEPSAPLFLRIPAFLGELAFASLTYLDAVAFGHLFELPI